MPRRSRKGNSSRANQVNKANLVVRPSTAAANKRWKKVLCQFLLDPWSPDNHINSAFTRRLVRGAMDEIPMMIGEFILFVEVLNALFYVLRYGLTAETMKEDDFVYIDMSVCDDVAKFFKSDSLNTVISAIVGGINRRMVDYTFSWKREHLLEIASGSIELPEWITNIPQIDIDNDPQCIILKKSRKLLRERAKKMKGSKGRKAKEILKSDELIHIVANLWDKIFAGVDNNHDINLICLAQISPRKLLGGFVFFWHIYKTGRGGGSARSLEWKRDIDWDPVDRDYVTIYPWGKEVDCDSNKSRNIHRSTKSPGLFELLLLIKKLRPDFDQNKHKKQWKHRKCAFLLPTAKVYWDKENEHWVAFQRNPVGKNNFDPLFQEACTLCGVPFKGSIYSIRFSIVGSLVKSGVSLPGVKEHWTTHSTMQGIAGYWQKDVAMETEEEQQEQFREYVNKNKNKYQNKKLKLSQLNSMPKFQMNASTQSFPSFNNNNNNNNNNNHNNNNYNNYNNVNDDVPPTFIQRLNRNKNNNNNKYVLPPPLNYVPPPISKPPININNNSNNSLSSNNYYGRHGSSHVVSNYRYNPLSNISNTYLNDYNDLPNSKNSSKCNYNNYNDVSNSENSSDLLTQNSTYFEELSFDDLDDLEDIINSKHYGY